MLLLWHVSRVLEGGINMQNRRAPLTIGGGVECLLTVRPNLEVNPRLR